MMSARKLVLVIHQDRQEGLQIKDEFLRLGVPACLVAEPGQLSRVVDTFRVHYVVTSVESDSELAHSCEDWLSAPGSEEDGIRVLNLREDPRSEVGAICRAVAMDLRRS